MNTPVANLTPDQFDTLLPGWTPEAWLAFVNSPANLSANALLWKASELKDAIWRHLRKHPTGEITASAGMEIPPRAARQARKKAAEVRRHLRGIVYALTEFTEVVSDFIPEPELVAVAGEGAVQCSS